MFPSRNIVPCVFLAAILAAILDFLLKFIIIITFELDIIERQMNTFFCIILTWGIDWESYFYDFNKQNIPKPWKCEKISIICTNLYTYTRGRGVTEISNTSNLLLLISTAWGLLHRKYIAFIHQNRSNGFRDMAISIHFLIWSAETWNRPFGTFFTATLCKRAKHVLLYRPYLRRYST